MLNNDESLNVFFVYNNSHDNFNLLIIFIVSFIRNTVTTYIKYDFQIIYRY